MGLDHILTTFVAILVGSPVQAQNLPAPYVDNTLQVYGRTLTGPEFYQRCIQKFTDSDFRTNPYLATQMTALQKSPLDLTKALNACVALLQHGQLVEATNRGFEISRTGEGLPGGPWPAAERTARQEAGLRVLRTFTAAHQTFFASKDLTNYAGAGAAGTKDLIDTGEPAYYLTWSLLGRDRNAGVPFTNIVKGTYGVKALRQSTTPNMVFPGDSGNTLRDANGQYCYLANGLTTSCTSTDPALIARQQKITAGTYLVDNVAGMYFHRNSTKHVMASFSERHLVDTGTLSGLAPIAPGEALRLDRRPSATTTQVLEFGGSIGGGLLGTMTYNMMNWSANGAIDGGARVPRKWSGHLMKDFLCVDSFPNLLPSDVDKPEFIDTSSPLEFRKSTSCMACHAAVDPLAFVARNLQPMETFGSNETSHWRTAFTMYKNPITQPSESGPVVGDSRFHLRPPKGELFFRNRLDKVVRVPVQGLPQLGQVIASQDDFYVCAAKKYYEYLTGVNVNIRKDESQLSPIEKEHYKNVLKAGLEVLKKTDSSEQLIRFILSTPAFRSSDFRAEAKQ